jgi:hypothetical protein
LATTEVPRPVISFRVSPHFRHLLRAVATREGVPVSQLVERVMEREVARLFREAPGETSDDQKAFGG